MIVCRTRPSQQEGGYADHHCSEGTRRGLGTRLGDAERECPSVGFFQGSPCHMRWSHLRHRRIRSASRPRASTKDSHGLCCWSMLKRRRSRQTKKDSPYKLGASDESNVTPAGESERSIGRCAARINKSGRLACSSSRCQSRSSSRVCTAQTFRDDEYRPQRGSVQRKCPVGMSGGDLLERGSVRSCLQRGIVSLSAFGIGRNRVPAKRQRPWHK